LRGSQSVQRDKVGECGLQSGQVNSGGGSCPALSTLADALTRFLADYRRIAMRVKMRDRDELLRLLRTHHGHFR
jgi:hypothetical protein